MREWKSDENVQVLLDETNEHRLKLTCEWDDELRTCLYIMFNPSTADANRCDRTLDRCISLAKENGFGSIVVVNLYTFRTPKPTLLWNTTVKNHPDNVDNVKQAINEAETVVAAWGSSVRTKECSAWVLDYAKKNGKKVHCLAGNKSGTPRHPLFIKKGTVLKEFSY